MVTNRFVTSRVQTVLLVTAVISASAKDLQRFPQPSGNITAVYQTAHRTTGRIAFVDNRGREIYSTDYSKSVFTPGPGQWTNSGRFFVYPIIDRYDDPYVRDSRFDIADLRERRVFIGEDLLNQQTTSRFNLSKQDTISFYTVDYDTKRRKLRSVSLSEQVPYIGGESDADAPTEKQLHPYYVAAIKAQRTGICNIHHVAMKKMLVPISWGLVEFSIGPLPSTEIRFFPHAREYVNGGCEIDPARLNAKVSTYVCPECQRAEWQWIKAHPKDPWSRDRMKHPGSLLARSEKS